MTSSTKPEVHNIATSDNNVAEQQLLCSQSIYPVNMQKFKLTVRNIRLWHNNHNIYSNNLIYCLVRLVNFITQSDATAYYNKKVNEFRCGDATPVLIGNLRKNNRCLEPSERQRVVGRAGRELSRSAVH